MKTRKEYENILNPRCDRTWEEQTMIELLLDIRELLSRAGVQQDFGIVAEELNPTKSNEESN